MTTKYDKMTALKDLLFENSHPSHRVSMTVESTKVKNKKVKTLKLPQLCECNCGRFTKSGRRFIHGHQSVGRNAYNYKDRTVENGYVHVRYEHPRVDSHGYVMEHRLIYEQYHKCCMLKWGIVHHINEITNDNRIENLEGMIISKHIKHHNIIDMSNRECSKCGSKTTYKRHWCTSPISKKMVCLKCYNYDLMASKK